MPPGKGEGRGRTPALVDHLVSAGPSGGPAIQAALGISQPTLSRAVRSAGDAVRRVGRARATRYFVPRPIDRVAAPVPVYEVLPSAAARTLAWLHPTYPEGFWVEPRCDDVDAGAHADLPWFLESLRPSGFLGRLAPRRHPHLEAPPDILRWTASDVLRYLVRFGWDGTGSLIVGDEAYSRYVAHAGEPPLAVTEAERATRYPALADDVLNLGVAGSSAAGEQPKFTVPRGPAGKAVLVKFSPRVADAVSRRVADLLVCEHLALEALAAAGQPASRSRVLTTGGRTFLEVERFDRTPAGGRLGVVALGTLDDEFGARPGDWPATVEALARAGVVSAASIRSARWLRLFGALIANTDMHRHNLSFFARGARVLDLCPAYDMTPAAYAPRGHELPPIAFAPPPPRPRDADLWHEVQSAAVRFWEAAAAEPSLADDLRRSAQANAAKLDSLRSLAARLPR